MNPFVKNARLYFCLALLFLPVAMLSGCATPEYTYPDPVAGTAPGGAPVSIPTTVLSNALDHADPIAAQSPDLLYPGVRLTITFSGVPPPSDKHEERIREDGYINPPLLGKAIKAAGRTVGQLQKELQDLYVPNYFKTATITVRMEETFFFVGGEVKTPGRQVYLSEMTVLKAIQTAGDFTDFAKRWKVQITRAGGQTETVNCDKALKNPKLDKKIFPNDIIFVPRRLL
jgi:polysaccharide export outer membrane protein